MLMNIMLTEKDNLTLNIETKSLNYALYKITFSRDKSRVKNLKIKKNLLQKQLKIFP